MSSGDLLLRQIEAARKKLEDDIKTERTFRQDRERYQEKWNRIKLAVALLVVVGAMVGLNSSSQLWPPAVMVSFAVLCLALIYAICDWNIDL